MTYSYEPVLLDTSVNIDALRGITPEIVALTRESLNNDHVLTSAPVVFEINRGCGNLNARKSLLCLRL